MALSRKHYIALAAIIREAREAVPASEPVVQRFEDQIVAFCRQHGGMFDTGRFRDACQPKTKG